MAMEHGKIVLKGSLINPLIELLNTPVAGMAARARNRFILRLNEIAKPLEARRQEMMMQHGDLKDGKLQLDAKSGVYVMKDPIAFQAEFDEMMKEPIDFTCTGEEVVDFRMVYDVLVNLPTLLSVQQTTNYNEVLEQFEAWTASQKPV